MGFWRVLPMSTGHGSSQVTVEVHRGKEQLEKVESLLRGHGFEIVTEASPASPAEPMVYARRA